MTNTTIQNQLRGTLLVATSGMLYGTLGFFGTKLLQENLSVSNMLFWRFLIASLWMMVSLLTSRTKNLDYSLATISNLPFLFFATITYCGSSVFYFLASKHIGIGIAMTIFFCYPIFVSLFAFVFSGWRLNMITLTALGFVFLGLMCLKGKSEVGLDVVGTLFAIVAAICYACYLFGSQYQMKKTDSRSQTFIICLGNTAVFFILALLTQSFTLPVSWSAWFYICTLGIAVTALPIQLLLDGLKYISPIKASILSVLEPVVTIITGVVLLHEVITTIQMIGIMVILVGTIFIQFERTTPEYSVESV